MLPSFWGGRGSPQSGHLLRGFLLAIEYVIPTQLFPHFHHCPLSSLTPPTVASKCASFLVSNNSGKHPRGSISALRAEANEPTDWTSTDGLFKSPQWFQNSKVFFFNCLQILKLNALGNFKHMYFVPFLIAKILFFFPKQTSGFHSTKRKVTILIRCPQNIIIFR